MTTFVRFERYLLESVVWANPLTILAVQENKAGIVEVTLGDGSILQVKASLPNTLWLISEALSSLPHTMANTGPLRAVRQ